jgi:hypothetical protein
LPDEARDLFQQIVHFLLLENRADYGHVQAKIGIDSSF